MPMSLGALVGLGLFWGANLFKEDQNMPDDEATLDYVLDKLVIFGDPQSGADQILASREETGPFKTRPNQITPAIPPSHSKPP